MDDRLGWRFEWRDGMSVGNPVLDAQHRAFFGVANDLCAAVAAGGPMAVVLDLSARLVDGLRTHFAEENRAMERAGYTELRAHRLEHALLLARAEEVQHEIAGCDCLADCHFSIRSLMAMLLEHLAQEDGPLKRCFSSLGAGEG